MIWFQFLHEWRPLLVLVQSSSPTVKNQCRTSDKEHGFTRSVLSSRISLSGMYRTKTRLLCAPKAGTSKFVWSPIQRRDARLCGEESEESLIIVRRNTRNQDIISGPQGTTTFARWREATTHVPLSPSTATVVVGAGPWLLLARGAELRVSFTLAGRRLQSTTGGSEACTVTQTEKLMINSWVLEERVGRN